MYVVTLEIQNKKEKNNVPPGSSLSKLIHNIDTVHYKESWQTIRVKDAHALARTHNDLPISIIIAAACTRREHKRWQQGFFYVQSRCPPRAEVENLS